MPTDPNDKMRTPGAARRRDMDGRAYKAMAGGGKCGLFAILLLAIPAAAAFDITEAIRLVTS